MSSYIGKEVVRNYARFRPQPPKALMENIFKFLAPKETDNQKFEVAADIGCGSGQLTCLLAPYFKKIYAFDTSEDQIEVAKLNNKHDNIKYRTGTSSSIALRPGSVDLIIASQAAHWFDLEAFFKEAVRVLKPTGVIALTGYTYPEPQLGAHTQELCKLVENFFKENQHLWHANNQRLLDRYLCMQERFPNAMRIDPLPADVDCSLQFLIDHLESRSGIQNLKKDPAKASQVMTDFRNRFLKIIGRESSSEDVKLVLRFNYFLLLWSKSKLTSEMS